MNKQQQELYEKLLKKVNEFCLGQAAEDVIEVIDNLVDTYESKVCEAEGYATHYADEVKALEKIIIKEHYSIAIYKGNYYINGEHISQEEYELLKEMLL